MNLTDKEIKEIASNLEIVMICFYHRPSGAIEYYPDSDNYFSEEDPWQEVKDKIEKDKENYVKFEKMDSYQAFQVMENFAYSLENDDFRDKVLERLSRPKPFSNFKRLIDYSEYRQRWFDFKSKAHIKLVSRQAEFS